MSKDTLYNLVDGVKVPLTEAEVIEFEVAEQKHGIEEKEAALTLYQSLRKAVYPSAEELLLALVEKDADGDRTHWDALMAKRREVKLKYPKPVPVEDTK